MAVVERLEVSVLERRRLALKSPQDLQPIGELECATPQDVAHAIDKARAVQPAWAALSFEERARYMLKARDIVLECQEQIIEQVVAETGKSYHDALAIEIYPICDSLTYYAKRAKKFLKPEKRKVHGLMGILKRLDIVYKPLGVIGIITPWNGPFALSMNPSIQALMAGNTVVLKGSEITPFSAAWAQKVFDKAGLPEGVFQVVNGDGETGAALVEGGVDKISFTGSVNTGRKIAEACGRQLIPCTLELGGKDAMIVCEDANLDLAAQGALLGACLNTGHFCCGTERIYVMRSVYDEFVQKVVDQAKLLRVATKDANEDVGAVFWDNQLRIIESHVDQAKAQGAKVLVGGGRKEGESGLYYMPTVMVDVNHDMDLMCKETFGPILPIMPVDSVDEAIQYANSSDYGLNGNVWSVDRKKAFEIAKRMETGSVCINDIAVTYGIPEAPFGGVKSSGVGQVNGCHGMRSYCHAMPIITNRFNMKEIPNGYPYDDKTIGQTQKTLDFLYKNPLGKLFH